MRRLFWLVMGITIGILVVRRASKTAQKLKPEHLAKQTGGVLTDLAESVRSFAGSVRAGMREREGELREGFGLDGGELGARAEDFPRR